MVLYVFDLSGKDSVFIGRSDPLLNLYPDINLGPYSRSVSRRHARIFVKDERYMLENVGNVMHLNNQPVPSYDPMALTDNDEIRLGGVLLRFKTP